MKTSTRFLRVIRWVMITGILTLLIAGFIQPFTIFQSLIVIPSILLVKMCVLAYVEFHLDNLKGCADIHRIQPKPRRTHCFGKKAA